MGRAGLVTVFLAALGRAIAEVGATLMVGGNIRGDTRSMTTAIARPRPPRASSRLPSASA